jgi:diguanylate cyclase (GGDEF)-like protein
MVRLEQLARTDSLTGVPNRRVWDEELTRGLERARRTRQRCTVGIIDLDHFKQYNDANGHIQGDALLKEIAQLFASHLRSGDLIARYGGEEFAVFLHECDLEEAGQLFNRLHQAGPAGQTFSAGLADTDGKEDDYEVVARADEALYRAKAAGRNRTEVIASPREGQAAAAA